MRDAVAAGAKLLTNTRVLRLEHDSRARIAGLVCAEADRRFHVRADRFVLADEAKEIGLVNSVHPHDEFMDAARELALTIAKGPTITLELDKKLIADALNDPDLRRAMQHEAWAGSISGQTEDSKEGMKSFMERRDPVFQGR